MDAKRAQEVADIVIRLLKPYCLDGQIMVVGSVRRGQGDVKDLELVAVPAKGQPPVAFGMRAKTLPPTKLHAAILALKEQAVIVMDTDKKKDGPKYKRFRLASYPRLAVDMFIADVDNFGNTVAIRTGDAKFSKRLVTPADLAGLLPPGYLHREGYLVDDTSRRVSCPTEAAFFKAIGIPAPAPKDRTEHTARLLWEQHREGKVVVTQESTDVRQEFESRGSGKKQ